MEILSMVIRSLIDNSHPLWHFYWFFAIAIPFWFKDTIPNWLGWGTDKPNILGWVLIALAIVYVVLLIVYFVLQAQYSSEFNRQLRVAARLDNQKTKKEEKGKPKKKVAKKKRK